MKENESVSAGAARSIPEALSDIVQNFENYLQEQGVEPVCTGIAGLDDALNGGLPIGITVLASQSGMGKSTLALQIASNVAGNEEDERAVLIFSMEMNKIHIVSKLLARDMFMREGNAAPQSKDIISGRAYLVEENKRRIDEAKQSSRIRAAAGHIHVITPDAKGMTISRVVQIIDEYRRHHKNDKSPLIIIDYLQILTPEPGDKTDKQHADNIMNRLRYVTLNKEQDGRVIYGCPVLLISSLNRSNYDKDKIDLAALKDSGNIEYSADVVISLEGESQGKAKKTADIIADPIRKLQLRILKQRYGAAGVKIPIRFYAEHDAFAEDEAKKNGC